MTGLVDVLEISPFLNFSDDDDDDVDDDDDIGERMSFSSNSQERERHPAVVYLVISPLAVTKPEQWYVQWLEVLCHSMSSQASIHLIGA